MLYKPKNRSLSTKITKGTKEISILYRAAIHPLGDGLQLGFSLNVFVLPSAMLRTGFVIFMDKMIFLGKIIKAWNDHVLYMLYYDTQRLMFP